MAEIKIVMTDMDGTYMENSFQANQQNLEATRKLAERGIPVCAVTARNLGLVRRMLHLGELETYCVNNQWMLGTQCKDGGKPMEQPYSRQLAGGCA